MTSVTTWGATTPDEAEEVSRGLITKQAQVFTIYPRGNGESLDNVVFFFRKITLTFIVKKAPERLQRKRDQIGDL